MDATDTEEISEEYMGSPGRDEASPFGSKVSKVRGRGAEKSVSVVPYTQFDLSNLQMVIGGGEGSISGDSSELLLTDEVENIDIFPLCSINPGVDWSFNSSD